MTLLLLDPSFVSLVQPRVPASQVERCILYQCLGEVALNTKTPTDFKMAHNRDPVIYFPENGDTLTLEVGFDG